MVHDAALENLRQAFPWPDRRPGLRSVHWSLDAGGKRLVIERIRKHRAMVLLEIGVCLGASVRKWLDAAPELVVIALDSWDGRGWIGNCARVCGQPEWVAQQLERNEDAYYKSFLATMWDQRERIIPVRARSPEALDVLREMGVQPDLVYLDGDKSGRELEVCRRLFPRAILTGDDWFYGVDRFWRPDEGYPIRKPVKEFCRRHGCRPLIDRHTWVIADEPPSWRHLLTDSRWRLKSMRRRLRGAYRWYIGRDKAA